MVNILCLTFGGFMQYVGYICIALLCFVFMVVVHEFGHYITGKLLGFKINEFAVGFGPAIIKHRSKKSGELFSLRVLPLGGYCAFEGEEDGDEKPREGSFNAQKPWKRIIVFIAGALFNYISAIILISIFFMAYGDFAPKINATHDIGAEQVFLADDIVLEVNGKSLYSMIDSNDIVKKLSASGDTAEVTVLRNGEKIKLTVNKGKFEVTDANGQITEKEGFGIDIGFTRYKYGFFEAIGRAFVFSFKVVGMLFSTIGSLFTGALGIKGNLGGPITAIGSMVQLSKAGFDAIMYGVCVLSSTLAIMNLLPLPALDGSKVVFTLIEWVRGKPLNRKVENTIHTVGLFLLLGLTIILDIVNFI